MNICFIGASGHVHQTYTEMKTVPDVTFSGYAPGSVHEPAVFPPDASVPAFEDYRTMLDEVKPDYAVVSPVFGLTGGIILRCAQRGIHVFAEKPVASSLEELSLVRKAVEESGIRFCAMHFLRYDPAFYLGAQLVREGRIGDVVVLNAQKSYKYGTRPHWYHDPALYGGTIPWVGIHGIDWIARFTGKRFLSATALSVGADPEMAALCQFQLEGHVIAAVNLDFYRPAGAPTHGDDRIRCAGTEGVLEVREGRVILTDKNGVTEYTPESAPKLAAEFLQGHPCISPEDIFAVTEAAIAARMSAASGKTVMIGA